MVSSSTPNVPAIGGCLRCHQIFLITDASSVCLICGRPPDLTLPFGPIMAAVESLELGLAASAEEPEAPILIAVKCPHCDNDVQLSITDTEISVVPPPPAPPVEEAAPEVLPNSEAAPSPVETPPPPAEEQPQ